ncbi:DUF742 domain-containing protein [Actinomadura litoris]|uniref:DUF742 domain-containing protein n=1 Tax=Actinomadura litoris TaxID=2678616 RepID=A0A7K1LBB9_9ACTN|nr:DUF742 domain-containing protein [Actinomadura litoris]MUN41613.1 DUF742 domain-containing protein [Actinomadura litoris]
MSDGLDLERLNALLEASSLGDPAAAKLRKRTSGDLAEAAVQRADLRTGAGGPAPEQRGVERPPDGQGAHRSPEKRARTHRQQVDLHVHDRIALDEIELYAALLIRAAAAERPLTQSEIDTVLGVGSGEVEDPSGVGSPDFGLSAAAAAPPAAAARGGSRSLVAVGDSTEATLVRPYVIAGGRVRPRVDLALEALVTAVPSSEVSQMTPEYRAIMDLCGSAHSVAEVSALLRLPLGVTRVLVADMIFEGLLRLHQSGTPGVQPDFGLLERVLGGLRKL